MSKVYKIPCSWQMYSQMDVRAESLDDAIGVVESKSGLPDGEYIQGSFRVHYDSAKQLDEEGSTIQDIVNDCENIIGSELSLGIKSFNYHGKPRKVLVGFHLIKKPNFCKQTDVDRAIFSGSKNKYLIAVDIDADNAIKTFKLNEIENWR